MSKTPLPLSVTVADWVGVGEVRADLPALDPEGGQVQFRVPKPMGPILAAGHKRLREGIVNTFAEMRTGNDVRPGQCSRTVRGTRY
jgi:hypothetical protein